MDNTFPGMPAVALPSDAKLIDEFVDIVERAETTLAKYKQHLLEFRVFLDAQASGKPLVAAEKADVELFLAHLRKGERYGLTADGKPRTEALAPAPARASSRRCAPSTTSRRPPRPRARPELPRPDARIRSRGRRRSAD